MRFGIITPTLLRASLAETCDSVNRQSYTDWRHYIAVDSEGMPAYPIEHNPRRGFMYLKQRYNNFGNTPRHLIWDWTRGCDYVIHLDDDNYFADSEVLADIASALDKTGMPDWACFPILRFGNVFFNAEPRSCHADTANIVVKREYGRWPDRPEYTADGFWMEGLRDHQPPLTFAAFPDFRPIIVMPQQGKGEL